MRPAWWSALPRAIIHINVADFAAAVEGLAEPSLRGRPLIVAPLGAAHTLVHDMSEEAFACGVRKHMDLARARRLCRDARLVPPDPPRYQRAMAELLRQAQPFSPLIEAEADSGHLFLDLSGTARLWGPPQDVGRRLRRQYQVLGFLTDRHPIVLFQQALPSRGLVKARDLAAHPGQRVVLAGWLITAKAVWSKKELAMQFVTFEDETSIVEATLFPKVHARLCHSLDWGRPFLLRGRVEENFGAATLTVEDARLLLPGGNQSHPRGPQPASWLG